ncbi:UNVERIFIED_CONTAM: hypothetical protein NCL1_39174 [Trichonephila clavipes]
MLDSSSYVNPTPLAHADTSRDVLPRGELKEKDITLSDSKAKEHDIEWLLGADVIGNILTGNSLKLSSGSSIRFVSWMLRFVKNALKKREFREIGDLTAHEIEHVEKTLIEIVQAKFFSSEDSLPNMNVIMDEEVIKRVKTRITDWSGECLFTQRLIEYYHRQDCHAGTQILLGVLLEIFEIVRDRRVVRKIVRNCVRCQRYKCKSPRSKPVSLPSDRVNDAAVFEVVGVDLAGPLRICEGRYPDS